MTTGRCGFIKIRPHSTPRSTGTNTYSSRGHEVLGEKCERTCTMRAEPTKRRSVAWQLAVGTVGLSVTLGGGVLGAGTAAAETVWTGPAIEDAFSCGGDVFLTFNPDARDAAQDVTYWVRTAPGTA